MAEGEETKGGQIVATWDPHTHPVVTDVAGNLQFEDFEDGVSVTEQIDEFTGLASIVVLDAKMRGGTGKDLRPVAKLVDDDGNDVCFANTDIPAVYALPAGAIVSMSGCRADWVRRRR